MFKHPGKKIMGLSVFIFIVGIVLTLCTAGLFVWLGFNAKSITLAQGTVALSGTPLFVTAAAVAALGLLASWVCALCLYAYGSLVDKTRDNNYMLGRIAAHTKEIVERMGDYNHREMNIKDE